MHLKLKRTPGLVSRRFYGVGKTTIAKMLADHVGWDYVDVDAEIEKEAQTTIAQIFDTQGEPRIPPHRDGDDQKADSEDRVRHADGGGAGWR
jgi:shikimate kinase